MMTNTELINTFINGNIARNGSMSSDGFRLFSYCTCIAERQKNGVMLVNRSKYSVTTSRQQNMLLHELDRRGVEYAIVSDYVRRGTESLV